MGPLAGNQTQIWLRHLPYMTTNLSCSNQLPSNKNITQILSTSTNHRSFDIGLQIICSGFELPAFSLTMCTFPSPSGPISTTVAIGPLFCSDCPSGAQHLPPENSFCFCSISALTYNLLELLSMAICCTCLRCFMA